MELNRPADMNTFDKSDGQIHPSNQIPQTTALAGTTDANARRATHPTVGSDVAKSQMRENFRDTWNRANNTTEGERGSLSGSEQLVTTVVYCKTSPHACKLNMIMLMIVMEAFTIPPSVHGEHNDPGHADQRENGSTECRHLREQLRSMRISSQALRC